MENVLRAEIICIRSVLESIDVVNQFASESVSTAFQLQGPPIIVLQFKMQIRYFNLISNFAHYVKLFYKRLLIDLLKNQKCYIYIYLKET